VCPERAIIETGRELGVIEKGKKDGLAFVHGILRVGEAVAPPLIKKVRSFINPSKINIIDAPPGTSCPVIAAMKGVDFVLLVTEPTPFGLHDLQLAVNAVKVLGLPCGLLINRSDVGNDRVREYAAKERIPLLMEIPFDRRIAEIYSNGVALVEKMPGWKEKYLALYQRISETLARKAASQATPLFPGTGGQDGRVPPYYGEISKKGIRQ
jgi:MinD superfamily P-loop ATPase